MNDDDDAEFSRLIPGIRRLQSDRVNIYTRRKTSSARVRPSWNHR